MLGLGTAPSSLAFNSYKLVLLSSNEPVIYLLVRTNTPNTSSIYLAKFYYASTSLTPFWSL